MKTLILPLIETRYLLWAAVLVAVGVTAGTAWTISFWRITDLEWHDVDRFNRFLTYLDLGSEDNIGAWVSSMLLLSIAAAAMLCFLADKTPSRGWLRGGWLLSAVIFAGLSFTEMGSIHERLPHYLVATFQLSGPVGWMIWGGPVILAIPVFMSAFVWLRLRSIKGVIGPMIGGILLLSSIPVQELFEQNMIDNAREDVFVRPIAFLILEEGSELAGMLCFLAAFLISAYHLASTSPSGARMVHVRIDVQPWRLLPGLGIAALLLSLGAAAMQALLPADSRSGTPTNWPPSAFAFLGGMAALFFARGKTRLTDKAALVALGLAGVTLSMLSAMTQEDARYLTILLILVGAGLVALTGRRGFVPVASLLGAGLAVYLAQPWHGQNTLLVAAMLLAAAILLWEYAEQQHAALDFGDGSRT